MIEASLVKELVSRNVAAQTAFEVLSPYGTVYLVGGAVRDIYLGKEPKDLDFLVTGVPIEQMQEILGDYGSVDYTGKGEGHAFGVILFSMGGDTVEIALPRVEYSTGKGHKEFDVSYDHNIPVEVDLGRRDFTVNSIALNLNTIEDDPDNSMIDPHNGVEDLYNGVLRQVNPKSFEDDPLRIVRAIVAFAKHGLHPDAETEDALKENADKIRNLPGERIQLELDKLLGSADPATALEFAEESGILKYIVPEVSQAMEFDQHNSHHSLPVGEHLLEALRNVSKISDDIDLRLAALLHDIGKPESFWIDEQGEGHFYKGEGGQGEDHEEVGADMARELMSRLHYPTERINRVTQIIQNHMFPFATTERGVRRQLNSWDGDFDHAEDLMKLREGDARAKTKQGDLDPEVEANMSLHRQLLESVQQSQNALTRGGLAINGNDLINMGYKQGPEIGETLDQLMEVVLDDPTMNNREDLISLAEGMKG